MLVISDRSGGGMHGVNPQRETEWALFAWRESDLAEIREIVIVNGQEMRRCTEKTALETAGYALKTESCSCIVAETGVVLVIDIGPVVSNYMRKYTFKGWGGSIRLLQRRLAYRAALRVALLLRLQEGIAHSGVALVQRRRRLSKKDASALFDEMHRNLFGRVMVKVCCTTLGPTVVLMLIFGRGRHQARSVFKQIRS